MAIEPRQTSRGRCRGGMRIPATTAEMAAMSSRSEFPADAAAADETPSNSKTRVIHIKSAPPYWRHNPSYVYIGRPTSSNPPDTGIKTTEDGTFEHGTPETTKESCDEQDETDQNGVIGQKNGPTIVPIVGPGERTTTTQACEMCVCLVYEKNRKMTSPPSKLTLARHSLTPVITAP